MVRQKLILVIAVSLRTVGLWMLISEEQAAQERREKFFRSTKEYPTSGGEKDEGRVGIT